VLNKRGGGGPNGMSTVFSSENLNGRDHLENPGLDRGMKL
jgi:hypothetical protein